jgi:hypothetical protein
MARLQDDPEPASARPGQDAAGLYQRLAQLIGDLGLAEVSERISHGAPSWFVRGKTGFVTLWANGHHGDDFPHLWCAGLTGAQDELTRSAPERFFRPPYVGHRGWIGVRLDGDVDWEELAELCQDAYRAVAPARLAPPTRDTVSNRAPG